MFFGDEQLIGIIDQMARHICMVAENRKETENVRSGHYTMGSKLQGHTEFARVNRLSPKSNRFFPAIIQTSP